MEELFVSYDLALALKKKGYKGKALGHYYMRDEKPCLVVYGEFPPDTSKWLPAPLFQQVVDWFREKHRIHVAASTFPVYGGQHGTQVSRSVLSSGWKPLEGHTYHEALNKAIVEALTLIK